MKQFRRTKLQICVVVVVLLIKHHAITKRGLMNNFGNMVLALSVTSVIGFGGVRTAKASSSVCASMSRASSFLGTTEIVCQKENQKVQAMNGNINGGLMQMKIKVGIVGLPNVGKSTVFNSLVRQTIANAENYPFCTISPNAAPFIVPGFFEYPTASTTDDIEGKHRTTNKNFSILQALQNFENSNSDGSESNNCDRIVDATMQLIDVAGLVKNAHKGDGLGNQFLATLRECTVLLHLIRVFPDNENSNNSIIHVNGKVDPVSDATDIHLELVLADLEHVQRRLDRTTCKGLERSTLQQIETALQAGTAIRDLEALSHEQLASIKSMGLLTQKPMVYIFNVDEVDYIYDYTATKQYIESTFVQQIADRAATCTTPQYYYTLASAKIEAAIANGATSSDTDDEDRQQKQLKVLNDLGIIDLSNDDENTERMYYEIEQNMSYNVIPSMLCKILGYGIVYTGISIPNERSKTIKAHVIRIGSSDNNGDDGKKKMSSNTGTTVYDFAGRIHGKIQKGFLYAEIVSVDDVLAVSSTIKQSTSRSRISSFQYAKDVGGIVRREGKDYCLQHNDVVVIKWKDG